MNRQAIRTPARSVSNLEFHHSGDEVNDIARSVVQTLEGRGIRAMNPAMGFPMEMDRFPGKVWVVSHKPVAVAAGLGMMGIHRNVMSLANARAPCPIGGRAGEGRHRWGRPARRRGGLTRDSRAADFASDACARADPSCACVTKA
jgi:hypothetical protein